MNKEMAQEFKAQPMWKVRAKLTAKSLCANWGMFAHSKLGPVGLFLIVFFLLFGLVHPLYLVYRGSDKIYDPVVGFAYDLLPEGNPHPPTLSHPLGTDILGRDVLGQLMYSTSKAFVLGLIAAGFGVLIS
ncbi:ABC transporter permease, partial [Candidatus Bipolaricaulota bacterium]|nr:ABC transporter permease [Candidatus Bipolaricaulota bacterium]